MANKWMGPRWSGNGLCTVDVKREGGEGIGPGSWMNR